MYHPFAQLKILSRPDSELASPSPSRWTPRNPEVLSFFGALELDDSTKNKDNSDDNELGKIFPGDAMDTEAPSPASSTDNDHLSYVFFRALHIIPEDTEKELKQQLAALVVPEGTRKATPVPEYAPSRKRGSESDQTFFEHPNKMRRTTYEPSDSALSLNPQ